MHKCVLVSVLVLVSLLSLERRADACSCGGLELYPRPDDVMPLDGKLWLMNGIDVWGEAGELWQAYCGSEVPVLVGPEGEIPLEFHIAFGSVLVMTPTSQLEPQTEYTVDYRCDVRASEMFATGTEIDDVPPSPVEPQLLEINHSSGDSGTSCSGESHYGVYQVNTELVPIIDVHADSELDPVTLVGDVDGVDDSTTSPIDGTTSVYVGRGSCIGNWPEADYGQFAEVRFATIDLAGNFSGWSEAVELDMGEAPEAEPRAGCAIEPVRTPAWLLGLAGLMLLGITRSRRRSPDRPQRAARATVRR